ncbi:MAG: hypothetical protein HZC02_03450 [Candidatus Levybacteria bacterium]|nr:hypothetical protein [Candidatus Levybacteria bacterium]
MKSLPSDEGQSVGTVLRIWEEIIGSMDQYTHDSLLSKFYLPEEILTQCKKSAEIFAQLLYSPIPSSKEIEKTKLYGLMYLSMACGVQIFLKERSIEKGYTPYKIANDPAHIRNTRLKIGNMLSEGVRVKSPVSQVIDLFIFHLDTNSYIKKFSIKKKEFNAEKFEDLLPAAIMWGYLTAKELVVDIQ